jgi:hypothetical protein
MPFSIPFVLLTIWPIRSDQLDRGCPNGQPKAAFQIGLKAGLAKWIKR